VWLWGIAKGIEEMPVEERQEPKSLSVEHTFEEDTDAWGKALETLEVLVDELHRRALRQAILFRTVGIKVRVEGFETHTRDRTLATHVQARELLLRTAAELLGEFRGRRIRLIGVRISGLIVGAPGQGKLPIQ
jgi:nucleotidyltransferase/DNA polymerase involved in DNA repair